MVPIANSKRNQLFPGQSIFVLTISVASTRVPTILRRTLVPFSMILTQSVNKKCQKYLTEKFTWSSEAKEGGLDVGSYLMSGWMSCRKRKYLIP